MFKKLNKTYLATSFGLGSLMMAGAASADIATDTQAAIDSAKATALTVGGYVVAAVAALVVIGLIISMVRKV